MCLRNTTSTYGYATKAFHWICAILVLSLLTVGCLMGYIDSKPLQGTVYNIHKIIGITTLCIGTLFTLWSLSSTKPQYPTSMAKWETTLATVARFLLYGFLLVMPFSGWIMSTASEHSPHFFGTILAMPGIPVSKSLANIGKNIHNYLAWIIAAVVLLHTLGALKHHFMDKNDVLKRMLFTSKANEKR